MFFDGAHKRRKEISLRGASKQENRGDVLQKAAAGRVERELHRKQNLAATSIQRFVRRLRALRQLRAQLRTMFDAQLPSLDTLEGTAALSQRLVAFYNPVRDSARLLHVGQALAKHTATAQSAEHLSLLTPSLKPFLLCLLRGVAQGTASGADLSLLLPSLVDASDMLFPNDAWLDWLRRHGAFVVVRQAIAAGKLAEVELIFTRMLQCRNEDVLVALSSDVLGVLPPSPALSQYWSSPARAAVIDQFVLHLGSSSSRLGSFAQDTAAGLLNHLIDFSLQRLETASHSFVIALLQAMQVLMRRAHILQMIKAARAARAASGEEDEEEEDESSGAKACPAHASPMMGLLFRRLQHVLDNTSLVLVFVRHLRAESWDVGVVGVVCSFLAQLLGMPHTPKSRADFLFTIAFKQAGVVPSLWKRWLAAELRIPYDMHADARDLRDGVHVLSEAFSHALLTLDDDELISSEWFAAEDLRGMVLSFTRLVFELCDPGKHPTPDVLESPVCKLLHRLHCRNVRLKFCAAGDWLVPGFGVGALSYITSEHLEGLSEEEQFLTGAGGGSGGVGGGAAAAAAAAAGGISAGLGARLEAACSLQQRLHVLRLLRQVPFVFPFAERARLFRMLVEAGRQSGSWLPFGVGVEVRRDHLYEDAFQRLEPQGPTFRSRFRVTLISEQGLPEAGIDGGGLFREFLTELVRKAFSPELGFFIATPTNSIYPNPRAVAVEPNYLKHMHFLGMILGKALFEGMLVDVPFAPFFLLKLLSEKPDLNDLQSLDPELHRNLLSLKHCERPEDLGLSFSVSEEWLGAYRDLDLFPGGRDVVVTAANRRLYLHLVADHHLNRRIRPHCAEFCRGLFDIVPQAWLRLFAADELHLLISGDRAGIDLDDFRRHVVYGGEFHEQHTTIQAFWRVVAGLPQEQLRNLLRFITSCPRPPLLGFRYFNPLICIHSAGHEARLPTASTCMNLLKLPVFVDEQQLREKLVYAINSGAGFELS